MEDSTAFKILEGLAVESEHSEDATRDLKDFKCRIGSDVAFCKSYPWE